jgi:hypothetical protein
MIICRTTGVGPTGIACLRSPKERTAPVARCILYVSNRIADKTERRAIFFVPTAILNQPLNY